MLAIQPSEYAKRRQALCQAIGDGALYVTAHQPMQRRHDMAYPFSQEANFRYLTGIVAPDWRLLLLAGEAFLVRPELTEVQKLFDGFLRDGAALEMSGADAVISQAQARTRLEALPAGTPVWTLLPESEATMALNPAPRQLVKELRTMGHVAKDCRAQLAQLRAIKSDSEIACIQQAVDDTIAAFETVRQQLERYQFEYEIEADMTRTLRQRGASGHAYDPIVAAGENACTLHYSANQAPVRPGDMVLLDVGAEVEGYAADITRTYATRPTERQRAVHAAVREAQRAIIAMIQPGGSVRDYVEAADRRMRQALEELGLLQPGDDAQRLRAYYPHATSHGLGLDVHDSLGAPVAFAPGMVLTVEPGIYIEAEGIGVRIEDDVLVTSDGVRVLSRELSTDWA